MKNLLYFRIFIVLIGFTSAGSSDALCQIMSDTANTSKHYVLKEFMLGSVKMKNGQTENAIMNYNQLTEEMIFEQNGLLLAVDSIMKIDTVNIDSRLFIPHEKVFYEILVKGKVSLFKQHKCNLLATGNPSGYGGVTETGASKNISSIKGYRSFKLHLPRDFYITEASQFWLSYNGVFHKANTVSQITKALPQKSAEIKNFVKLKKLNIDNPEDRVILIVKCNELVR